MTDDQTRPIETPKPTEPAPAALPPEPAPAPLAPEPAPAALAPGPAPAALPPEPAPAPLPPATPSGPDYPAAAAASTPAPTTAQPAGSATPAGPDYEPVATTPVVDGASRRRWIVALGAAGIAIALTVGAVMFLGRSSLPEALRYVPGDAAVVIEVRPELPGDQMQKLGNFLAKFPGFRDQASLPDKIDEALSRVVSAGSGGGADYRADVKPWLNGPMFIAVAAPANLEGTDDGPDEMLVSATTNGSVACTAVFDGQAVNNETYAGLTLVVGADGDAACVVDGRQALIGEPATVRKALDAKNAGTGMDKSAQYLAARNALPADQLASFFVSGAAVRDLMGEAGSAAPVPGLDAVTGAVPDWTFVGLRAEDDALVVETVAAPAPQPTNAPSLLPLPATHPSVIAPLVPGDTLFLLEDQGTGVSLQNLLARLKTVPEIAAPLQMLDGMGGAGELVGWIDDAGVAVGLEGSDPRLAVLLAARDDATAANRAGTISSLLGLLALSGGGVDVQRTTVNEVEVTSVTIQDLGSLVPPGSVPGVGEVPATGPITFSFAVRGRILLLTSGPDAMADILNVQAGQSLADQAAFKQAGQRGLANSRTNVYVAAGAALDVVQPLLPAEIAGQWATEFAPYLDPIQAIGFTTSGDSNPSRSRVVFTVAGP